MKCSDTFSSSAIERRSKITRFIPLRNTMNGASESASVLKFNRLTGSDRQIRAMKLEQNHNT